MSVFDFAGTQGSSPQVWHIFRQPLVWRIFAHILSNSYIATTLMSSRTWQCPPVLLRPTIAASLSNLDRKSCGIQNIKPSLLQLQHFSNSQYLLLYPRKQLGPIRSATATRYQFSARGRLLGRIHEALERILNKQHLGPPPFREPCILWHNNQLSAS
jgi:hypothetical protein